MRTRAMTLTLSGLVAGFCLTAGELSAWQRSAMDDCKKEMEECKNDANNCKKDSSKNADDCKKMMDSCKKNHEQCKKDADSKDNSSFEMSLSNYNRNRFKNLTPEQKKKMLDYADKNKMTPDAAFDKVMKK